MNDEHDVARRRGLASFRIGAIVATIIGVWDWVSRLSMLAPFYDWVSTTRFGFLVQWVLKTVPAWVPLTIAAIGWLFYSVQLVSGRRFSGTPAANTPIEMEPNVSEENTSSPGLLNAALQEDPAEGDDEANVLRQSSTSFFSTRFAQAFPGLRGTQAYTQPAANERLAILLQRPLSFRQGMCSDPIWFWAARGELAIDTFELRPDGSALMDVYELEIEEIIAVNEGAYYREFVYVRTGASAPTGLYDYSYINGHVDEIGDATEEYAIYRGRNITRAEYDDGAAEIDGKPVDVRGETQLRVRYLTPSNFIVAAKNSPINASLFDGERQHILNAILRGERTVADLTEAVLRLPKRETYGVE